MHLDISLALTVSNATESNDCAADPATSFLSKSETAAIFADSSVASRLQKSLAAAKGRAASPFFFSH